MIARKRRKMRVAVVRYVYTEYVVQIEDKVRFVLINLYVVRFCFFSFILSLTLDLVLFSVFRYFSIVAILRISAGLIFHFA